MYECSIFPKSQPAFDVTTLLGFRFSYDLSVALTGITLMFKRCLLLGRKVMTNLNSILKTETLLCQQRSIQSRLWFFQWSCIESWTVKKAVRQRIDAFELWCWRRLLRVPWTTRRSNQFIIKEISSEYSLEGLMLKLKL